MIDEATLAWRGELGAPKSYSVKAKLRQIGANPVQPFPGLQNLAGEIDATEEHGTFKVASRQLGLNFPHLFEQPLFFDTLQAKVAWRREKDGLKLEVDDASFANSHASGTASVEYR